MKIYGTNRETRVIVVTGLKELLRHCGGIAIQEIMTENQEKIPRSWVISVRRFWPVSYPEPTFCS